MADKVLDEVIGEGLVGALPGETLMDAAAAA
jgi:hypothetical protein